MDEDLELAKSLARRAGDELRSRVADPGEIREKSSATDVVTSADLGAEKIIVNGLPAEDGVLTEESPESTASNGRRWIIDPLDGTANYRRSLWPSVVSIALEVNGQLDLGVVYDFHNDGMYSAAVGYGAWRNDQRLQIDGVRPLGQAFIGLSGTNRLGEIEPRLDWYRDLSLAADSVRDYGSSAMSLCLVAEGSLDAHVALNVNIWDVAAGFVIAREAGCVIDGDHTRAMVAPASLLADIRSCLKNLATEASSL